MAQSGTGWSGWLRAGSDQTLSAQMLAAQILAAPIPSAPFQVASFQANQNSPIWTGIGT